MLLVVLRRDTAHSDMICDRFFLALTESQFGRQVTMETNECSTVVGVRVRQGLLDYNVAIHILSLSSG
jgi:hypothetical protein